MFRRCALSSNALTQRGREGAEARVSTTETESVWPRRFASEAPNVLGQLKALAALNRMMPSTCGEGAIPRRGRPCSSVFGEVVTMSGRSRRDGLSTLRVASVRPSALFVMTRKGRPERPARTPSAGLARLPRKSAQSSHSQAS